MHMITYEQPLNERMRTFLRIEDLLLHINHRLTGDTLWDNREALNSFLEILNLLDRSDLKSEAIKELERHISRLDKLQQIPNVDTEKLNSILSDLHHDIDKLQNLSGKIGHKLKEHVLLQTVKKRIAIPGGVCNFDVPEFYFWLQQPQALRIADLNNWISEILPITQPLSTILALVRNSSPIEENQALNGFYQKTLDPNAPIQLVRVSLPANASVFPETSGSKHRISIRFLRRNGDNRPSQSEEDIQFSLCCCS